MKQVDRAVRWFADINGAAQFICGTVLFFVVYTVFSNVSGFDPFPFLFLTCIVSLVAITQNQAVLYVGKGLEKQNTELLYYMRAMLDKIEAEESQELIEIRHLIALLQERALAE